MVEDCCSVSAVDVGKPVSGREDRLVLEDGGDVGVAGILVTLACREVDVDETKRCVVYDEAGNNGTLVTIDASNTAILSVQQFAAHLDSPLDGRNVHITQLLAFRCLDEDTREQTNELFRVDFDVRCLRRHVQADSVAELFGPCAVPS